MKNCSEINEIISLYIDNEINADECKEIEEHIDKCPACKKELDEILQTINLCRNIEEKELPLNFKQELHRKLLQLKEQESRRDKNAILRARYTKIISSVAAGLLLIFFMQGMNNSNMFSPNTKNDSAESINMKAAAPENYEQMQDAGTVTTDIVDADIIDNGKDRKSLIDSADETEAVSEKSVMRASGANENRNITGNVENRLVTLEINVDDLITQTEKIKSIAAQFEGKEAENKNTTFSEPAPSDTLKINNEKSIVFIIPNRYYEDFANSLKNNYGESNFLTSEMVSDNISNTDFTNVTIILKR